MNDPATCKHENFRVDANVARIEDVGCFSVDIRLHCAECGHPFQWWGLPCGFSHYQPCVNIDGTELRAPIIPKGAPAPSAGLPAFIIKQVDISEIRGEQPMAQ